jgi:hypothetical protein
LRIKEANGGGEFGGFRAVFVAGGIGFFKIEGDYSGAFFGGLRYGEGTLYTRNAGDKKVFWQGPSLGFDFGGDGSRTMMLVYKLPNTEAIYQRFGGVDGSAYVIGGFSMTALMSNDIVLVPISSGVGARLGINIGYLKFTPESTWNPF